jgi:hypothetical protein
MGETSRAELEVNDEAATVIGSLARVETVEASGSDIVITLQWLGSTEWY